MKMLLSGVKDRLPQFAVYFFIICLLQPVNASGQNLLSYPESIVFDEVNNRYLLSNQGTGDIVEIDENGNQDYFVRYQYAIQGVEISGNAVYVGCESRVKGYDLTTGTQVMNVLVPEAENLNDVVADTSGFLYSSDVWGNTIYKFNLTTHSYSPFATDDIFNPNGLYFDAANNRLLLCSYRYNSPIQAISLEDSTVTTLMSTDIDLCDGITADDYGNYYVTSWRTTAIYRIDSSFSDPPEWVYTNGGGPADISYNSRDDVLAIPLMNIHSTDFFPVTPTSLPGEKSSLLPRQIGLSQNFPNPFNPRAVIRYGVPEGDAARVVITIHDLHGRLVRTLVDEVKSSGEFQVTWDGIDDRGLSVASGVYFSRMLFGQSVTTRKMTLLR